MTTYYSETNVDLTGSPIYAHAVSDLPTTAIPYPVKKSKVRDIGSVKNIEVSEKSLDALIAQGFSEGLARSLIPNVEIFPIRFWIIDNSGSMNKPDGHRIIETLKHNNVQIVDCTRWEEIKECVNFHAQLSSLLCAPTVFRLLNDPGVRVGPQEFSIAEQGPDLVGNDQQIARTIMNKTRPSGFTPLKEHIYSIRDQIVTSANNLKSQGQKAVVVIATDGMPTDEMGISSEYATNEFVQAMRLLEGLPVWIVIRLCTDDDEVVNFYNDLDEQLELSLEVLDDYVGEAKEVYEFNSWLNYGLPIHRLREFGFHERVFDLIDERRLTKGELREFCLILFGEHNFDSVPDPSIDWISFLNEIERLLKQEKRQYDPIKKKVLPWIDTREMNRIYGPETCCTIL